MGILEILQQRSGLMPQQPAAQAPPQRQEQIDPNILRWLMQGGISYNTPPTAQGSASPRPEGMPQEYYTPMQPEVDRSSVSHDPMLMGGSPQTYNNVRMAPAQDSSSISRDRAAMGPQGGPQTYNNMQMAPTSDSSSVSRDPTLMPFKPKSLWKSR